jgi:hypothetical protein
MLRNEHVLPISTVRTLYLGYLEPMYVDRHKLALLGVVTVVLVVVE